MVSSSVQKTVLTDERQFLIYIFIISMEEPKGNMKLYFHPQLYPWGLIRHLVQK